MYANEELDAVLLCVSPQLHPALAIEAFNAGLHVWMEKPAGAMVAEIDAMIAARGDRVAVVGYKKAFMPATDKALELLARESMQPLRTIFGVYPMNIPHGDRDMIERRESNKWLVDGCHPVALLLTLGGRPESVVVHRGRDNSGVLVIRHVSGSISNLHLAQGAPPFQPIERYLAFGGSESVEIENSRRLRYQRGIEFSYANGTSFAPAGINSGAVVWEAQDGMNTMENKAVVTQGMYGELEHFADCVRNGRAAERSNLEFARDVMAVFEAAVMSDGNEIKIAQ
jgi:predicted dehydrogenase